MTYDVTPIVSIVMNTCVDPENFLRGVQIPRRGLRENFKMAKIDNLAIPREGGGGPDPLSPPSGSAHGIVE